MTGHFCRGPKPNGIICVCVCVCLSAVDYLQRWLDQPPPRDPSWLRKACLDEHCTRILDNLSHAAAILLRDYLSRLLLARALPPGSHSRLLEFLGRKIQLQLLSTRTPAEQILQWLGSGLSADLFQLLGVSRSATARLESAPEEAQRMLFIDLQLRFRLGVRCSAPVPERSHFFEEVLYFFWRSPSTEYPVWPPSRNKVHEPGLGGAKHLPPQCSAKMASDNVAGDITAGKRPLQHYYILFTLDFPAFC